MFFELNDDPFSSTCPSGGAGGVGHPGVAVGSVGTGVAVGGTGVLVGVRVGLLDRAEELSADKAYDSAGHTE